MTFVDFKLSHPTSQCHLAATTVTV